MLGGDTLSILEIFVVLVAAATVVAIVARRLTILPYSVGLVGLGLAVRRPAAARPRVSRRTSCWRSSFRG